MSNPLSQFTAPPSPLPANASLFLPWEPAAQLGQRRWMLCDGLDGWGGAGEEGQEEGGVGMVALGAGSLRCTEET